MTVDQAVASYGLDISNLPGVAWELKGDCAGLWVDEEAREMVILYSFNFYGVSVQIGKCKCCNGCGVQENVIE